MMPVHSLTWLALLPLACAFRDTVPVVAWSSHTSSHLDTLTTSPKPFTQTSHLFEALLGDNDLCQYEAIVVAEQPGLHASDLRTLPHDSYLSVSLSHAASSLQIPYLSHSNGDGLDYFKRTLMERCGSRLVELGLAQGGISLHGDAKHIVCVNMPHLEGEGIQRKGVMRDYEIKLSNEITRVASVFPRHLVIYMGSQPLTKRQDPDFPSRPVIESSSRPEPTLAQPRVNATLAAGGLLHRYQFFTPGLITALLVAFGLLIPVVMMGIYALASIQSPLRVDAPRGPSLEKKNQ